MVTEEEQNYFAQLEAELADAEKKNRQLSNAQMSMFGLPADENLIKYQLDLREDLDRIYHLLQGHQLKEDDKGNTFYVEPSNSELKPFNEFGTQMIMNIMAFYLNRNTILSNYDEDTINWKIADFGYELIDLIFNRYEDMMMTTTFEKEFEALFNVDLVELPNGRLAIKEVIDGKDVYYNVPEWMIERTNMRLKLHLDGKMKMYPMVVKELVDTVHSTYLRALHGEEKKSLREARTVTQSDPINRMPNYPTVQQPKQFKLFNPTTWGR